ncbi:MAG TPA: 16S rRNA (cytosine(1402)-N(4))-methyltransferase RsmH [Bacillota bacterium]|nr:16S rRNA (cytosine(1402)-N(4))-methyltransferase RsmH [Bacillota bacterium]
MAARVVNQIDRLMTQMKPNAKDEYHTPVMSDEVVWLIHPRPGGVYIDCTLGSGGHALGLLEFAGAGAQVIGIDRDQDAISAAKERLNIFRDTVTFVHGNFSDLQDIVKNLGILKADGILFDLGVSSHQLDEAERGFSYMEDGPLDMRMGQEAGPSAKDLINTLSAEEIASILKTYGEERWADRIAEFIVKRRDKAPVTTTGELADIVKAAIPAKARRSGPHPARRTFQALRIAVNQELDNLHAGLDQAIRILRSGGRLVVISYHSLEDRIVKTTFLKMSSPKGQDSLRILTKKPIVPCMEEIIANPRSRSAKLRAAEKF